MNSGAYVQGLSYLLQADNDLWLVAICGNKFYTSAEVTPGVFNSTMTDSTGAYGGISSGTNKWDLFTFNDSMIGFGGARTSPDVPIIWTGSGNIAALGGTSPTAYGGFTANNRVFAFRTAAAPSSVYWSVIGSATDWAGTGSGSAVVGSLSDNQEVTAAAVISTNYALVFKQHSTYQMIISAAPFPIYTLFDSIGCVGKRSWVNVNGEVYFINAYKRMCSTDGQVLREYPKNADDLWNAVDSPTAGDIEGFRQKGVDYDWIVWVCLIGGVSKAIIWDLENKCWLRCTTGYNMHIAGMDNRLRTYMGGEDGFIYKPDQAGVYADASAVSPGTIASYWRSGWVNPGNAEQIVQIGKMVVNYRTRASGSITVNYGFDFVADSKSFTLAQAPTGSETMTSRSNILTGRGNFFQFKIGLSSSTIDMNISSATLYGKVYGQKRISAS